MTQESPSTEWPFPTSPYKTVDGKTIYRRDTNPDPFAQGGSGPDPEPEELSVRREWDRILGR
jgi:hypothetical protein